jgi:hypothetical protein
MSQLLEMSRALRGWPTLIELYSSAPYFGKAFFFLFIFHIDVRQATKI